MRVYRSFAAGSWKPGDVVSLDREESRHLGTVRRLEKEGSVLLLDGAGGEYDCEVMEISRDRVTLQIRERCRVLPRPRPLAVAWGLTKSPAFDDIFHRAVELGMTDFVPLHGQRGDVRWDAARWEKKQGRYGRLSIEALKQCERLWLPNLHPPGDLGGSLDLAAANGWKAVLLHEREEAVSLGTLNPQLAAGCLLLIGPEGGWTPEETGLAISRGALLAHLGRGGILRTETAVLAALAVLNHYPLNGP